MRITYYTSHEYKFTKKDFQKEIKILHNINNKIMILNFLLQNFFI